MRYHGIIASVALVPALMLAGCGGAGKSDAPSTTAATEAVEDVEVPTEVPSASPPPPAQGRSEKEDNGLYQFTYSYPDAVAAIPDLRAMLDRKLDDAKGSLRVSAQQDKAEAAKSGYPYRPHSDETQWQVVANLPDFLSLSSQDYAYEGGAHGNTAFDALVWDRRANTSREPLEFFVSNDALRAAIQPAFCDALDKQRAGKRGTPVNRASGDEFDACIDPVKETVILGSKNGQTFDRIGILVAPYDAGPYAEGTYDVTVPVTGKVMAALKPQYRTAFSPQP